MYTSQHIISIARIETLAEVYRGIVYFIQTCIYIYIYIEREREIEREI